LNWVRALGLAGASVARSSRAPEPAARPGERRAWSVMRLAWIPILIVVALIVYAVLR
jgi:hypothetical protein